MTGNGLGIRVVGGKEVPGSNGDIGAYVAKVLPGGAAEQTGKILEGKLFYQNKLPFVPHFLGDLTKMMSFLCFTSFYWEYAYLLRVRLIRLSCLYGKHEAMGS